MTQPALQRRREAAGAQGDPGQQPGQRDRGDREADQHRHPGDRAGGEGVDADGQRRDHEHGGAQPAGTERRGPGDGAGPVSRGTSVSRTLHATTTARSIAPTWSR